MTEMHTTLGELLETSGATLQDRRDWFAAAALQGYIAAHAGVEAIPPPASAADYAQRCADALLEQLARTERVDATKPPAPPAPPARPPLTEEGDKPTSWGYFTGALKTLASVADLLEELKRARARHPTNGHLLVALMEEVGEVSNAALEAKSREDFRAECIQVACVALRLAEEGDPEFPTTLPGGDQ